MLPFYLSTKFPCRLRLRIILPWYLSIALPRQLSIMMPQWRLSTVLPTGTVPTRLASLASLVLAPCRTGHDTDLVPWYRGTVR